MKLYGLDLETVARADCPPEFALQPWRRAHTPLGRSNPAEMSWVGFANERREAVSYDNRVDYLPVASKLSGWAMEGAVVVGSNVIFDVAWLIAERRGYLTRKITWLDMQLFWKWLDPNRMKFNLPAACREFLMGEPWIQQYLELKAREKEEGFDTANTHLYVQLDAYAPIPIIKKIIEQLTPKQLNGAMIESKLIHPCAQAWVTGVPLNLAAARAQEGPARAEMEQLAEQLGLSEDTLGSPVKLSKIIWDQWMWPEDLKRWSRNPDSSTMTDKGVMTYATDVDPRAGLILDWRKQHTRLNKYIESPVASCRYNGELWTHPSPKLYSTYTGRMTYTSKIEKKKAHPIGVALHQWCREKAYRAIIEAPPGFEICEFDAAGQEMRLMALQSGDPAMLQMFLEGKDCHSVTGAAIGGIDYNEFMVRKAAEEEAVVGPRGYRLLGKVANLGLQYRTSPKSLRRIARVDYGVNATLEEAKHWYRTYFGLFPRVRTYWETSITKARELGYAETLGGRRYYLPLWKFTNKEWSWSVESTSLNFPIQGSGADQKELAIATLMRELDPELFFFMFDLHDGLFFLIRKDLPDEKIIEAKQILDTLDYNRAWGWTPSIALPWDAERGRNWGNMRKVVTDEK